MDFFAEPITANNVLRILLSSELGPLATIGTANMDVRSFELNYEIISVLYESKTVHDIKRDFEEDFKHSTEIKWNSFQKRSIKKRILESFMRLISPLL